MIVLYLNTAGETSEIALYNDTDRIGLDQWQSEKRLGNDLLPRIDALLKQAALQLSNLTHIAVFPGPGSFTGTRVGVTTANTLAWSLKIPVVMIDQDDLSRIQQTVLHADLEKPAVPKYGSPASVTFKKL